MREYTLNLCVCMSVTLLAATYLGGNVDLFEDMNCVEFTSFDIYWYCITCQPQYFKHR